VVAWQNSDTVILVLAGFVDGRTDQGGGREEEDEIRAMRLAPRTGGGGPARLTQGVDARRPGLREGGVEAGALGVR
jgi:hypothetical protein